MFQTGMHQNVKQQRTLFSKLSRNPGIYSPRVTRVPAGQAKGTWEDPLYPYVPIFSCLLSPGQPATAVTVKEQFVLIKHTAKAIAAYRKGTTVETLFPLKLVVPLVGHLRVSSSRFFPQLSWCPCLAKGFPDGSDGKESA